MATMENWVKNTVALSLLSLILGIASVMLLGRYSMCIVIGLSMLTPGIISFTLLFPYHLSSDITGRRILPRGSSEIKLFIASYLPILVLYILLLLGYGQDTVAILREWLIPILIIPGLLMVALMLHYGLYKPVTRVPVKILVAFIILLVDTTIWVYIILATGIAVASCIELAILYLPNLPINIEVFRQLVIETLFISIPAASLVLALIDITMYRKQRINQVSKYGPLLYRKYLVSKIFTRLTASHLIVLSHGLYDDIILFIEK
ncbi:hypothetical protein [Desulfurococcus sp.]|uniref:hypothetical protein n=1 Tax=Desulfurococcus sp. TaxID=51678 RepID=UPI00315FC9F5